jgi:hypothetical protein
MRHKFGGLVCCNSRASRVQVHIARAGDFCMWPLIFLRELATSCRGGGSKTFCRREHALRAMAIGRRNAAHGGDQREPTTSVLANPV